MAQKYETMKRSHAATKGHFNNAIKAFKMLLDVKPHPTQLAVENAYNKFHLKLESVSSSTENYSSFLQNIELQEPETIPNISTELQSINDYFDEILSQQCTIESLYANYLSKNVEGSKSVQSVQAQSSKFEGSSSSLGRPSVRLTALDPPSWNGVKADFFTWKKKFIHIMSEANITDELIQLCYLQNSKTLPSTYQICIVDCTSMSEVWSRLEERVPRENIKYEIIAQLRNIKPLSSKKTPSLLRDFANEISLFGRRMTDIGFSKESYTCIIIQDIYEHMDYETTLRYRSKMELKRELNEKGVYPTEDLECLSDFLRSEATTLELSQGCKDINIQSSSSNYPSGRINAVLNSNQVSTNDTEWKQNCILGCARPHKLIECEKYLNMSIEKKFEFIKNASRCYVCLGINHRAQNCSRKRENWVCKFCNENNHHWSLCRKQYGTSMKDSTFNVNSKPFTPNTIEKNSSNIDNSQSGGISKTANAMNSPNIVSKNNLLHPKDYSALVLVEVKDRNGNWVKAKCFLDTGSNSSLVRSQFANQLQLYGNGTTHIEFGTAGGQIHKEKSREFEIEIRPIGSKECYTITATGIKKPCFELKPISPELIFVHEHLKQFRDSIFTKGGEVDLLIGLEYAPLIIPERVVRDQTHPDNYPSVAITRLGCYVYGGLTKLSEKLSNSILTLNHVSRFEEDSLKDFFYGDIIGVKPSSLCVCSNNEIAEAAFIKHVKNTTYINSEGRVCIEMPWKSGFPENLPNNYSGAMGLMIKRENQLLKNGKLEIYNREIQNLVNRNVVNVLSSSESEMAPFESAWYLNHRMIEKPDKQSSKFRMVFDSAALFNGISLNDTLEKGPDLSNSLFHSFLKWRLHQVAVAGDMEKMFNQVAMSERDQKYHRFIWRDGDISLPVKVYQWARVLFGDKPSPDLVTYAIRFLATDKKDIFPVGADILENNTYVDDVIFSTIDDFTAILSMKEVDGILCLGKFSIKNWSSNSIAIDQNPDECISYVFGHEWDKRNDRLKIKFKLLTIDNDRYTKRSLVSLVAKIWDPFGYLLPVSIKFRINLQEIWHQGYDWDQPISDELVNVWKHNIFEMEKLIKVDIKRCLKPIDVTGSPQLHAFSDGGEQAFGTCVFIRWPTKYGINLKFVAAKAFVAPLKYKTTPRLELMAAVAMARLTKEIEYAVDYTFEKRTFWIDSKVVIHWLLSSACRFKPFVSTRIQEFQDTFQNFRKELHYIPSENNPADCLTKPINIENLVSWLEGKYCSFLNLEENSWPQNIDFANLSNDIHIAEIEKKPVDLGKSKKKQKWPRSKSLVESTSEGNSFINSIQAGKTYDYSSYLLPLIIDYSLSWKRIMHAIAYLKRILTFRSFNCLLDHNPNELYAAEMSLFYIAQENLRYDMKATKQRFLKYNPVIDENGIIRSKGRLENTIISDELKYPILLPSEHPLIHIFALQYHKLLLHQGYRVVLCNLSNRGIVIGGGKELLKKIANDCMFCRTRRRKLLQQQMGILPSFKINLHKAPFISVAMDFCGYFKIKMSRNVCANGSILVITCTTSRCIHLELCQTIDTNSFLRAWRRFTSLRGIHPNHVFSDGGSSFKGALPYLVEWIKAWNQDVIKNEFDKTQFDFEWKYNIPTASHMNGIVESLIKSVRKGLDASVNSYSTCSLTFEEWATILAEISYIINSRPLFPSGDPLDSKCITGNDLLHPFGQPLIPQSIPKCNDTNYKDMFKMAQCKIDEFWSTWVKHIPPQLNLRNKWYHSRDNIQKGDFVLVLETGLNAKPVPRALWKKAIVVDTYPGTDKLVRKVKIRDAAHNEYMRPIHKLCLVATREELEHEL